MAITYFRNLPGRDANWGQGNDRTLRRSWLALTDTRYTSEALILPEAILVFGAPVPFLTVHPDDPFYLCKRLMAKQEKKSPLHWIIDAEYDTKPWGDEEEEKPPLDRRAKIRWRTNKYQKAVEEDRDGEAILNSAGYYFDPPPMKDLSRWIVTVSKNVSIVPTDILDYPDCVNDAAWSIGGVTAEINAAKIMEIDISDLQKEQDQEFYVFTYSVEFDKDLWKGKYLNQGFYDADGERVLDNGTPEKPVVYPWPLDDSGFKIDDPTPATATFSEYDIYQEMDFGILPVT
jgi:hypothetical protein